MEARQKDVAIVGGGIVGLATALALAERLPGAALAVLEKEDRLAAHQTGRNSGVIHAGIYYKPGSRKAKLCVAGVRMLEAFCEEEGVPFDRCGKLIVAVSEEELPRLDALLERGTANGIPGLEMVGQERAREIEPHVAVLRALYSPNTSIVDYAEVAGAMARRLAARGVEVSTGARVTGIRRADGRLYVETTKDTVAAGGLISCAGLHCDRIARMMGIEPGVRIIPFRGEYYNLRPGCRLVRGLIYPVPDPQFPFLGVHFTKRIRGPYEAGPNAVLALAREGYRRSDVSVKDLAGMLSWPGFWSMGRRHWRTALYEYRRSFSRRLFHEALRRLVPGLAEEDLKPGGSGVRAQAVAGNGSLVNDFLILEAPRALHVLNAPSPAATASLAIGRQIAETWVRNHS